MKLDPRARALLSAWFGDDESKMAEMAPRWFSVDEAFDARLRQDFGDLIVPGAAGGLAHWESTPEGTLALVVLLDQLSRNLHRGDARSFSQDPAAREVVRRALVRGADRMLSGPKRSFMYLPLMHSEWLEDHAVGLSCFETFEVVARGGPWHDLVVQQLKYMRLHTDVIQRFGRYPHRNPVLGRQSTPAELAFLEDGRGF